jgi:hypothetical protein
MADSALRTSGFEVEVGGEVAGEYDDHAGIGGRGLQVKGVDGPGKVGQVPGDVEFRLTQTAELAAAQPCDEGADAPPGEGLAEGADEPAGAAGAFGRVVEVRDP